MTLSSPVRATQIKMSSFIFLYFFYLVIKFWIICLMAEPESGIRQHNSW